MKARKPLIVVALAAMLCVVVGGSVVVAYALGQDKSPTILSEASSGGTASSSRLTPPQNEPEPQALQVSSASSASLPGHLGFHKASIAVSKSILTMTEPLTIHGSGFDPGEPVLLMLVIDLYLQRIIGGATGPQVTANSAGAFQISFSEIGGSAATQQYAVNSFQPLTILAQGSNGSRASVPVTIVASRSSSVPAAPVLTATPSEPGGETIVRGAGFQPGEAVTLVLVGGITGAQDNIIGSGFPNTSGAFQSTVLLSASLPEGVYTVKAEAGAPNPVAFAILIVGTQ